LKLEKQSTMPKPLALTGITVKHY